MRRTHEGEQSPSIDIFARRVLDQALGDCDDKLVEMLLKRGVDLNEMSPQLPFSGVSFLYNETQTNVYLGTALHIAARYSNAQLCSTLLEHGADPLAVDSQGSVTLHLAVRRYDDDLVSVLSCDAKALHIAQHQDLTTLIQRMTPLLTMCMATFRDKCNRSVQDTKKVALRAKYLLGQGADISATDSKGCTALHRAVEQENIELVCLLVSEGLKVEKRDDAGCTALHYFLGNRRHACKEHQRLMFDLLYSHEAHSGVADMTDLLHLALREANWTLVEYLIEKGATRSPELVDDRSHASHVFHTTIIEGRGRIVDHLYEVVPPNKIDGTLHHINGKLFELISSAPNHRYDDSQRSYSLEEDAVGCLDDYLHLIEELVRIGADINHGVLWGNGILRYAIHLRSHPRIVSLLLKLGADVTFENTSRVGTHDILLHAALVGDYEIFMLVYDHIKDSYPGEIITVDCWRRHLEWQSTLGSMQHMVNAVTAALTQFGDLECPDHSEWTLLLKATYYNNIPIARALLQNGANVEAYSFFATWTPLFIACALGHEDMVKLLLNHGANVNPPHAEHGLVESHHTNGLVMMMISDTSELSYNGTPLIVAISRTEVEVRNSIVKLLLGSGADVNACATRSGSTWEPNVLALAVEVAMPSRSYRAGRDVRQLRSGVHKAVASRLPKELTDIIADQFIAAIDFDTTPQELVELLLDYGADPSQTAGRAGLPKIAEFAGAFESLSDDRLRLAIEGEGIVYEYDSRL